MHSETQLKSGFATSANRTADLQSGQSAPPNKRAKQRHDLSRSTMADFVRFGRS
jgi:hypothetical protein